MDGLSKYILARRLVRCSSSYDLTNQTIILWHVVRIYICHRTFVLIMDFCLDFVFAIYLLRSLLCLWWYCPYSYLVRYYVFDVKWCGWKMNPDKQTNHSTLPIFWCTVCILDHLARRLKDQYGWSVQIYIGTSFGKMLFELCHLIAYSDICGHSFTCVCKI